MRRSLALALLVALALPAAASGRQTVYSPPARRYPACIFPPRVFGWR